MFLKHKRPSLRSLPLNQAVPREACVTGTQTIVARGVTRRFGVGDADRTARRDVCRRARSRSSRGRRAPARRRCCTSWPGSTFPDEGDVLVDGVSLGTLDRAGRAELRRRSIAFVGQTVGLVPFLGARENAEMALPELAPAPTGGRDRRGDRRGRPGGARRATGGRALGGSARARGAGPRPRREAARDHRRRADSPGSTRANSLALGTLLAEVARTLRNDRHLRDPRPAADRAGRRRALARIGLDGDGQRHDPGQRRALRALRRTPRRHACAHTRGSRRRTRT